MADEWKSLQDDVLSILKDGVADFSDETKDELTDFLKKKSEQIARNKWNSIQASTEEERSRAKSNLKHLYAQVSGEIARTELVATKRAGDLLLKVLQVTIKSVSKMVPNVL